MNNVIRYGSLIIAGIVAIVISGCVTRTLVVTTEPEEAVVYVNGDQKGVTPLETEFTFYGTYKIEIEKEGYERLIVAEDINAPWYEMFPLDLFSELLIPLEFKDEHALHYILRKHTIAETDKLIERAKDTRKELEN